MLEFERSELRNALIRFVDRLEGVPSYETLLQHRPPSESRSHLDDIVDAIALLKHHPDAFEDRPSEAAFWAGFHEAAVMAKGGLFSTSLLPKDRRAAIFGDRYDVLLAGENLTSSAIGILRDHARNSGGTSDDRRSLAWRQIRSYRQILRLKGEHIEVRGELSPAGAYKRANEELLSLEKTFMSGADDNKTMFVRLRAHLEMIEHLRREGRAEARWSNLAPELDQIIGAAVGLLREFLDEEASSPFPTSAPPLQASGPHFAIVDGRLDFAPPDELDPEKNNISRLRALLPILRQQVRDALELFGGNQPFPRIRKMLDDYGTAIEGVPEQLDYNVIAGYGMLLANAESAALRDVRDRLAPEMEDGALAALRSILDLHGPFILSTEAGRNFLSDAAIYDRTPEQEATFREASVQLAVALSEDGIAADRAASFVIETVENIGVGSQPTRTALFGTNTVRNVSIALMAGAVAALPAAVGLVTGSGTASWITTVIVAEGLKKSNIGVSASNVVRDAINDPIRKQNFIKLAPFILRYEAQLRAIAGTQRESKWLHDWLDWLKANALTD
ncbi:hypothetical protein ELH44_06750 [Rhizobium ruizarguesonis]|uniref:hypothetical protein n=1 Tax=Rhizobium ruizarguesonis TaxID=2081791 RepID=UPI001030AD90|nr:hypothetical protein [Rhizobium ruizarguesonis]TBB53385.1 hypothetical protein ELH44_06750 [Rhizobium ruizarguesonis]